MTTTETAQCIRDRSLSLRYEAKRFPTVRNSALAWLRLAAAWAKAHGLSALQKELEAMCYGMNCPHENRYSGECTFHGRGTFPCAALEKGDGRDEQAGENFTFSEAASEDDAKENAA